MKSKLQTTVFLRWLGNRTALAKSCALAAAKRGDYAAAIRFEHVNEDLITVLAKARETISLSARNLPRIHVRIFKPQFASLVEAGTKCQTVRPTPKRMPKPGDRISLRMWTGKPYRSKQRVLRESIISEVAPCSIYETAVYVNGKPQHRHRFAVADGFSDYNVLAEWFKNIHGLPFFGVVIKWDNH